MEGKQMRPIEITINIYSHDVSIDDVDNINAQSHEMKSLKWFHHAEGFGGRLHEARRNTSYTQQTLADELGVSQSAVTEWEKGRAYPKQERIEPIAKLLNVTPEYLLGTKQEEDNEGT